MSPRFWIVALAEIMPHWLGRLAVALVENETRRIKRRIHRLGTAIENMAAHAKRLTEPPARCFTGQNASNYPYGLEAMAQQNAIGGLLGAQQNLYAPNALQQGLLGQAANQYLGNIVRGY